MSTRGLTSYAELAEVLSNLQIICRETRRVRGLSLRETAEQIGIGFNTLTRIEQGADAVMSNVIPVLRWLHAGGTP